MKAETQIVAGVVMFVAGLFVGRTLALGAVPRWDWAALANVALNGALVWAAFYGIRRGFGEWRRQFVAKRDHDLAIRILAAFDATYDKFDELRTRNGMLSDGDVPVPSSQFVGDEPVSERQHRVYWARYRARQKHLAAAAEERHRVAKESINVWGELGGTVMAASVALSNLEAAVLGEAGKLVQAFAVGKLDPLEDVDKATLYSPDAADGNRNDPLADAYEAILDQVTKRLSPYLQMAADSV